MFFKKLPVVQDSRSIGDIGNSIITVHGHKFQLLVDLPVAFLDFVQEWLPFEVFEQTGVQESGVVDVAANGHDVRIIFPDKPCFQNGHGFIG